MQNLVSRIAGVNNEELANRGIGMGAAMGYTIKSIAYQFKGNNEENGATQQPDFISKVVNKTNNVESKPIDAVSYESYSKNAMEDKNSSQVVNATNLTENKINNNNVSNEIKNTNSHSGIRKAFNVGKEFMNLGMYMAEGRNFRTNSQEPLQRRTYNRPNINNTREEDKKEENNKIITVEVDDAND